jgi:hypothetical protein
MFAIAQRRKPGREGEKIEREEVEANRGLGGKRKNMALACRLYRCKKRVL